MVVVKGADIDGFDGVKELGFEGSGNIYEFVPGTDRFGVVTDGVSCDSSTTALTNGRVLTREVWCNEQHH